MRKGAGEAAPRACRRQGGDLGPNTDNLGQSGFSECLNPARQLPPVRCGSSTQPAPRYNFKVTTVLKMALMGHPSPSEAASLTLLN